MDNLMKRLKMALSDGNGKTVTQIATQLGGGNLRTISETLDGMEKLGKVKRKGKYYFIKG